MKQKILLILGIIVLLTSLIVFNAKVVNVKQLHTRQVTISSNKIDENLDGLIIAYFADLEYGDNVDEDLLDKTINTINDYDPDIIIFGGDLINGSLNDGQIDYLTTCLASLNARLGKFYVHGVHDNYELVDSIFENAKFKLINNETISIYNKTSHINLVGLSPLTSDGFNNDSSYTFVISHSPDTFELVINKQFDYFLAGQSHGGQVYLPIISLFNRETGCESNFKGKTTKNNKTLDITNGIGTSKTKARLFANSEIVIYKLKDVTD